MYKNIVSGIYKIENLINGKIYIGRSNNIRRRWKDHIANLLKKNSPLYNEIKMYGLEFFLFSILEICDEDELFSKEMFYIKKYNSFLDGYNQCLGGKDGEVSSMYFIIGDILNDLKTSDLKMIDIANKYSISLPLLSMVNRGKRCKVDNEIYPIRENKPKSKKFEEPILSKRTKESKRPCKEDLLEDVTNSRYFSDVARKYGVSATTIRRWLRGYGLSGNSGHYHPKKIEEKKQSVVIEKMVLSVKDGNSMVFNSVKECVNYISDELKIKRPLVRDGIKRVLRNKRNTYHGFMFSYL